MDISSNLDFDTIAIIWLVAFVAFAFYRFVKYDGLRGSSFGARVKETVWEVEWNNLFFNIGKTLFRISVLDDKEWKKSIGIEHITKTTFSYHMTGISFSKDATNKLIELLKEANSKSK